ncbi:MAG: hypothetical protein HOV71_11350 [Hamadaea sp.]|nr:hypothetical protein [Hamadaea sp.]NUR48723.1 hypothetical protein [Hamadaea sp.]NUT06600.1 hypothetical protein [Hamadaea sp.]
MGSPEPIALEPYPIKIEFARRAGVQDVTVTPVDIVRRSGVAVGEAMSLVRQMAENVRQTVHDMVERPSEVEISFGIKFDSEAGALVAKAGVEAALNVTLRWSAERPA